MNRVLITGGAGFIGSHIADALFNLGYKIRILDNLCPPVHSGKWPDYLSKKYELIKGDVREKNSWLKALKGVDYIYHMAAYQDYLPDFSKFFDVNDVSTALMYEIIVAKKFPIKKIIIASSQAVYGEGKYKCGSKEFYPAQRSISDLKKHKWDYYCAKIKAHPIAMKECQLLRPHNSYGMSKVALENIGLNLGKRYGIPTVAIRYSIVQGARQSFFNAYSGALRIFTLQALSGTPITVYENGEQVRDFVNIKDAVRASVLALKNKKADFEAFNVGGGRAYKVLDFAKLVEEITGSNSKIVITKQFRVGDTRNAVSDISKAKKLLNWKPRYNPKDSIKEYVFWIKNNFKKIIFSKSAVNRMKKLRVLF